MEQTLFECDICGEDRPMSQFATTRQLPEGCLWVCDACAEEDEL